LLIFGTPEQAAVEKVLKPFPQGRFAPWAEAQGLQSPMIAKYLMSELKLRPPLLRGLPACYEGIP